MLPVLLDLYLLIFKNTTFDCRHLQMAFKILPTLKKFTAMFHGKFLAPFNIVTLLVNLNSFYNIISCILVGRDFKWCLVLSSKSDKTVVKNAYTRTGLALALFGFFYPKEELKGRRLHELDQDVIEAITGILLLAVSLCRNCIYASYFAYISIYTNCYHILCVITPRSYI